MISLKTLKRLYNPLSSHSALCPRAFTTSTENAHGHRVFYSPNNALGLAPLCIVWTVKDPLPCAFLVLVVNALWHQCLYILISHFEVKVLGLSDHFHFYLSIVMRPWAYYCNKP